MTRWGVAYKNALSNIQCAKIELSEWLVKKDWRYPTEKLFAEFNVRNVDHLYLNTITTAIYIYGIYNLKKKMHNQLYLITHDVSIR